MTSARGDYKELWDHITPLVLVTATKDYIVFIDQNGDIDWESSPQYDDRAPTGPNYNLKMLNARS